MPRPWPACRLLSRGPAPVPPIARHRAARNRWRRAPASGPALPRPPSPDPPRSPTSGGDSLQPAGPPRDPEREHHVDRGMRQLGLPDGEPGTDQVDDGQYSGDPEPRSGFEDHDAILVNDSWYA